ncbi:MAG: sulfotransferase family protein [Actinomycetota bacterium]
MSAPIFVVGYMHSGTTLLLNILKNHPDLYCAEEETKFFMHLGLVRRQLGDAASADDAILEYCRYVVERGVPFRTEDQAKLPIQPAPDGRWSHLSDIEIGRGFRAALDTIAREAGKTRWVEKTPTHVFNVEIITAAIPDVTFLEIARDPRDILASKKSRKDTAWSDKLPPERRARRRLDQSFDPLWDGLSWKSAIRAGASGRRAMPQRWTRIRYEDLVVDPDGVTKQVCAALDLAFDPTLLDVSRGIPANFDERGSGERGVASTSVGRWRDVLTSTELAVCRLACRREMDQLGYATDGESASIAAAFGAIATRSLPEFIDRALARYRMGGTAYLREVAAGYVRRLRKLARR